MLFEYELLRRIPEYKSNGIIDAQSAERLSKHLNESLAGWRPLFSGSIYFAGIILLEVSACFFAVNIWDGLPRAGRLALAFVPLIISAVYGMFVLLKNFGGLFRESAAVVNIISVGVLICASNGALNISGNFHSFSVEMMCFSLALTFLFNSNFAAATTVVWCAIFSNSFHNGYSWGVYDSLFALAFFLAVFIFAARGWSKAGVLRTILGYIVCACAPFTVNGCAEIILKCSLEDGSRYYELFPWVFHFCAPAGLGSIMLLAAGRGRFHSLPVFRMPYFFVGLILSAILLVQLNTSRLFENALSKSLDCYLKIWEIEPLSGAVLTLILFAVFAGWAAMFTASLLSRKHGDWGISVLSLMFPLWLAAVFTSGDRYLVFAAASNIIFFISASVFAFSGIGRRNFFLLNVGVVMLVFQGMVRVMNSDIEVVFRAVFFGVCGIILMLFNWLLSVRKGVSK